ncbi:MAG: hypothetical protein ACLRZH_15015 [Ruthenibacterium lactatiformans]
MLKMLPIRYERREAKNTAESLTIYERPARRIRRDCSGIWAAFCGAMAESVASEQGRDCVDAASKTRAT